MNFVYSITISFVVWILGLVLLLTLFLPDIHNTINSVNTINQDLNKTQNSSIMNDYGTDNLLDYTPLSILSGLDL
jgi:hypothetical protein